jgi:hypothetical protein
VRCPNPICVYYSRHLVAQPKAVAQRQETWHRDPRTGAWVAGQAATPPPGFDADAFRIDVAYRNFRGDEKSFTGDWRTLRRRGRHVSLQVLPTGTRIALAIERIGNYAEVEAALARRPSPQEMRVMRYHARRGTTSARCDELRRAYPDWSP